MNRVLLFPQRLDTQRTFIPLFNQTGSLGNILIIKNTFRILLHGNIRTFKPLPSENTGFRGKVGKKTVKELIQEYHFQWL